MRALPVTAALVLALVAAAQPALAKGKKGRKKPAPAAAATTPPDEPAAPAEPAAAPASQAAPLAPEPAASAPPEPAREPAATTPAADKPASKDDAAAQAAPPGPPPDEAMRRPHGHVETELFELGAGLELTGRKFNYNDGVSPNLRSYQLFPGPAVNVSAQLYPFADRKGILSDVGLAGSFSQIMLVQSNVGSTPLQTSGTSYWAGIRARIHPGGRLLLGASLSFASTSFNFSSTDPTTTDTLPAETYRSIRPGVDLRVPIGPLSVVAGVAFRAVVGSDGLSARFRSTSVNGVEGEAGAVVALTEGIEARLVGRYERYFYSFRPAVTDKYIAGGALDEFFGARLSVDYLF